MKVDDLLAVSPKLLAQAILHRRERLAEMIPNELEMRKSELIESEPLAKIAREERDNINSKVANLKKERNNAQKKARELFENANMIRGKLMEEGGIKNPDPKWAKDKLAQKLNEIENQLETSAGTHKTEERFINEMKSLIKEHEEWVEERSSSQPLVKEMRKSQKDAKKLLDVAQKAHNAMVELVEANATRHDDFMKWEEVRRRSTSSVKKLDSAMKSSHEALEFWKNRIANNQFEDLIEDALRVKNGGKSSKSKSKSVDRGEEE